MGGITPTDKGALFAGVGISLLTWLSLFKLDTVAKLLHVNRWISQDKFFARINRNKAVSLLCTEICNYLVHGISSAEGVLFAMGSTIVNVIFIFGVLPAKMAIKTANKIHIVGKVA